MIKKFDHFINENTDNELLNMHKLVKKELANYGKDLDDRWVDIRQLNSKLDSYFEDGYFHMNNDDFKIFIDYFSKGLNYTDKFTYKMGDVSSVTPDGHKIYKAYGNETLFRGVSLKDWERIQEQGYIDSDMRGAISEYEGINLGQKISTAT